MLTSFFQAWAPSNKSTSKFYSLICYKAGAHVGELSSTFVFHITNIIFLFALNLHTLYLFKFLVLVLDQEGGTHDEPYLLRV